MNEDQLASRTGSLQGYFIHPDDLRIGIYVHLDLGWMEHPFTFSSFKIKDQEQIQKLRALKLERIRYDPKRSDVMPEFPKTIQAEWVATTPPPKPVVPQNSLQRSNRLKSLNEAILESEREFSKNATTVRESVRNLIDHPEQAKKVAENLVKEMVDSVITESDVVLHAISRNNIEQASYIHPLNVTVLALMLAKSMDMSKEDAAALGIAAMFHDVGKEEQLQNKSFVDLHCEIGARIATRSGLSEQVARIIQQHHEYMDGSGSPAHIQGDQIDPLARVLALVNHYDNLCNPLNPLEAKTPYEALSQMFAAQSKKFDTSMLHLFVRLLGVYPPGSIVQLSNEKYGIVLSANPNKPLLPLVMVYVPEVARETPVVIDFSQGEYLTISKPLRPTQLPREAFDYLRPSKRISYYFLHHEDIGGPEATDTGDKARQAPDATAQSRQA